MFGVISSVAFFVPLAAADRELRALRERSSSPRTDPISGPAAGPHPSFGYPPLAAAHDLAGVLGWRWDARGAVYDEAGERVARSMNDVAQAMQVARWVDHDGWLAWPDLARVPTERSERATQIRSAVAKP
ncbi:MAG: hypothetical protein KF727_14510 [Microbacteriaceae bacterium]|nr:hypothetical protein [Microbacteriaceae bacterium]